ncbi:MAG: hypothetical protein ACI9HK_002616 [Pirellulaceae bacterium]|jgi:hypothetical protein
MLHTLRGMSVPLVWGLGSAKYFRHKFATPRRPHPRPNSGGIARDLPFMEAVDNSTSSTRGGDIVNRNMKNLTSI